MTVTITKKITLDRSKRKPQTVTDGGRIPRVTRLMALAIRFDQLIQNGVVSDQAELARLGHVTRARPPRS